MYKLLLCWRYLLTRYLALACIISVMLGVATLIVVNSVMGGFSTKLRERLHGLLSDIVIEAQGFDGFPDPDAKIQAIWNSPLGGKIEAMTPTMEVMAMIQLPYQGQLVPRPIHLIGIDPIGREKVGGFGKYLVNPANRGKPSFGLTEEAELWHRRNYPPLAHIFPIERRPLRPDEPPPPEPPPSRPREQAGVILGFSLGHYRHRQEDGTVADIQVLRPGDEVVITTVSGQRLAPVYDSFVIADYFKSEMSEYDSNYVFVPLEHLQRLRTMEGRVTSIQIKLKDWRYAKEVRDTLRQMFPDSAYRVSTWEEKQGPLLSAIAIEKGLLNVLLFLIIAVAGFGILAIFAMIVAEKTRDIGILKALGASNAGVMNIFLSYGLLLGLVGAGFGTALGLAITIRINEIEQFITRVTGQEIFDRSVYYFNEIPTDIQTWAVVLVNVGAVAIAVLFSILPALKAAMLQPVRALRYE